MGPPGINRHVGRAGHLVRDPARETIAVDPHERCADLLRGDVLDAGPVGRVGAGHGNLTGGQQRGEPDDPAQSDEHDDDEHTGQPPTHPLPADPGSPLGETLLGRLPRPAGPTHRQSFIDMSLNGPGPEAPAGPGA